jgi:hypothetical protein
VNESRVGHEQQDEIFGLEFGAQRPVVRSTVCDVFETEVATPLECFQSRCPVGSGSEQVGQAPVRCLQLTEEHHVVSESRPRIWVLHGTLGGCDDVVQRVGEYGSDECAQGGKVAIERRVADTRPVSDLVQRCLQTALTEVGTGSPNKCLAISCSIGT